MTSPTFDIQSLLRDGRGSWTLDSAGSSGEFYVKHFWGTIIVQPRAEVVIDRAAFGMTWSPLGMAARQARAVVTACFRRA